MNIDSIVFSDSYDMPLKHPTTDEPLTMADGSPMFIRVVSSESPQFKALQARYRNEALRNPNKKMTAEKEQARMTEMLVACTIDWRVEGAKGSLKFSPDEARKLYAERPWVRNQVVAAVFDDGNFLGESKAA
ncbi:MAG: hypothetical protein MZU84_03215 [Sphingobacterium sp.]|nr:hypothetical protein [Sphingobacterium sp.]